MVVLTAGKGHQYSNTYNKKGTASSAFFVMKNILEGDKEIKALYCVRALSKQGDVVEKAFGALKERLNMRRLLVSSEQGLKGKLFVQTA